ncbi:MAG: hypothetical protein ABSF93_20270 [Candidatus Sulfotelmatobacter sp.]|jgi:hypothetical protein
MGRTIDQIRASKLPSNMMQFAARGALQVPAAENIEILVHLARHNPVFGPVARMTLAGWDEKSSVAAAADPQTTREVLEYLISPDNLRPPLLPALLENPSVPEAQIAKLAIGASRESIAVMLKSKRVRSLHNVLDNLKSNPFLKKEEAEEVRNLLAALKSPAPAKAPAVADYPKEAAKEAAKEIAAVEQPKVPGEAPESAAPSPNADEWGDDEALEAYLKEHAHDIAAEGEKPFKAIGGILELLGEDYYPVTDEAEAPAPAPAEPVAPTPVAKPKPPVPAVRENALQKINHLDVKGRIQLALKGNKEERSLLIRDGTKVVALAVLEAPKLSDGEVEKFASQKNVLESVLRQIPLKRKFMKNYKVVRNLVANPRTPLDLGLGLMKHLLSADLKNISANKDVSETVRKLALKMYKQKEEQANRK